MKGRNFESLAAQNLFLTEWVQNVADTRIHGTTRQQVGKLFETVERPALQPLPTGLFPVFEEAPRTVHRDVHVEFIHALAEPGKFTTDPPSAQPQAALIERGVGHLLDRCRLIGPLTGTSAETMHQTRGPHGLSVMRFDSNQSANAEARILPNGLSGSTQHGLAGSLLQLLKVTVKLGLEFTSSGTSSQCRVK